MPNTRVHPTNSISASPFPMGGRFDCLKEMNMDAAVSLRAFIELHLTAFRAVIAGPDPEGSDMDASWLEEWTPVLRGAQLSLAGNVEGHPALGRTQIDTSPLIHVSEGDQWARTLSRWYRLGAPLATDTANAFPETAVAGYCAILAPDVLSVPLHFARRLTDKRPVRMAKQAFELGFDDLVPALTLVARTWPTTGDEKITR